MSQWTTGSGRWVGGAALIAVFGFVGCGDDPSPTPSPEGGAAGKGGAPVGGSTAGKGGKPSTAGKPSVGGSSEGGSSGAIGGEGGAPIAGGSGGAAGSDAGAGGEAGERPSPFSPLPAVPADPTNRVADVPAAAVLGQRLFFDEKFSGALKIDSAFGTAGQTARVSCVSCHSTSFMDDGRATSIGTDVHTRNSPTLVNASFYTWTNWGGRFSAQWELPLAVVENGVTMNGSRLQVVHRIFDAYKAEYEAVFGTTLPPEIATDLARFPLTGKPKPPATTAMPNPPDGYWETTMTAGDKLIVNTILANYSKAIAAYMRLLVSRKAPFDKWVEGDATAISASAQRGLQLFVGKANCSGCHSGPHFSDQKFHDLGAPGAADDGRHKDVPGLLSSLFNRNGEFSDKKDTGLLVGLTNPMPDTAKGQFRTPGLRSVAMTAPYMHSGGLATLEAVIDFYDAGGGATADDLESLNLTAAEKTDLVAFLKTLTGELVPAALLVDTAAP